MDHLKQLGILKNIYGRRKTHRGRKAGSRRVKQIPVFTTSRPFRSLTNIDDRFDGGVRFDNLKSLKQHINDQLNFCSLNTRSIRNKTIDFVDFVLNNNLDIIAISETWLKADDFLTIGDLTPVGYSFQHVPRLTRTGGGVGLLYRSSLSVALISETITYSSFEAIHAEIKSNSQSVRLVNIYRSPGCHYGHFLAEFENMIVDYLLHPSDILFCGDFNIHQYQSI